MTDKEFIICSKCGLQNKHNYYWWRPQEKLFQVHCRDCGSWKEDINGKVVGGPQGSDFKQLALA